MLRKGRVGYLDTGVGKDLPIHTFIGHLNFYHVLILPKQKKNKDIQIFKVIKIKVLNFMLGCTFLMFWCLKKISLVHEKMTVNRKFVFTILFH